MSLQGGSGPPQRIVGVDDAQACPTPAGENNVVGTPGPAGAEVAVDKDGRAPGNKAGLNGDSRPGPRIETSNERIVKAMGNCNTCPLYLAAEKFAMTSCIKGNHREYNTEYGRLISAAVSARGLKLSDVSGLIGRAPDYVARICRGDLALGRPAALAIGRELGIDLLPFVGDDRKPVAPELPGVVVPVAPGINVPLGATSPLKFEAAS